MGFCLHKSIHRHEMTPVMVRYAVGKVFIYIYMWLERLGPGLGLGLSRKVRNVGKREAGRGDYCLTL